LVRLHSECLTGDAFGSLRCDCGPQLERSLERVAAEGGVVVYLRGHEGRGVGLVSKLRAYALQDKGFDTVDAQTELDLPVDAREYAAGAAIVTALGVGAVRLLTNNPAKVEAMRQLGIEVAAVERLHVVPTAANRGYLRTKRDRMGHDLVVDASDSGETA
jgi:3,4-dihydroxy 2-butanone 4-phosphate synthase/GTP cyclohydrolase II